MNYDGYIKYDEKVATNYDIDRQEEEHWRLENAFIEKFYQDLHLQTLLDLPVGTGRFLQYYPYIDNVVGIDISDDMLNQAKEKIKNLQSNINLHKGDAFHLEYPDNYFMHTVCFRLVHLVPPEERQKLFNELSRVTSEKIILQVYMNAVIPLHKRFYNKLTRIFTFTQENAKPWNHITSYGLLQEDFDHLIQTANLIIDTKTLLCDYKGGNVYVFELSKINN